MVAEFRTSRLPVGERFACRRSQTTGTLLRHTLRNEHASGLRAEFYPLELGAVHISGLRYPRLETHRPAKPIRRFDPEDHRLMLNLRGGHRIVQGS